MEYQLLLGQIAKHVTLTAVEQELLVSRLSYRNCLKGQFLVQHGEICKYEFFILSGTTRTFYLDAAGQEHIVMFAIEEWWTSDMGSFITQTPADFYVQCVENTRLIQFTQESIEQLFIEIPKLERFFRKIIERALVSSQKRIVRNFSMNARDRYVYFKQHYPKIEQRIPQYMIASYLGISKEFLSKIKSQLIMEQ